MMVTFDQACRRVYLNSRYGMYGGYTYPSLKTFERKVIDTDIAHMLPKTDIIERSLIDDAMAKYIRNDVKNTERLFKNMKKFNIFTKADLKNGMVVEYRNGDRRLVLNEKFIGKGAHTHFYMYTDDLMAIGDSGIRLPSYDEFDIVKVYDTDGDFITNIFDTDNLELIWERKVVTISKVKFTYKGTPAYYISEEAGKEQWNWTDDMFEGLVAYEEMTVEEIEEKLGYKIKVVADK